MRKSTQRRIRRHLRRMRVADPGIGTHAMWCLGRWYGARAFDALTAACDDPDSTVRWRAAWGLAYAGDPRAFATILHLTRDPEGFVRYEATIALGILGDPRAAAPLVTLLCTPDPVEFVDQAAYDGLGRLGQPSVPAIRPLLRSPEPTLRANAALLLARIQRTQAISEIAPLLDDPDETVRSEAASALEIAREPAGRRRNPGRR